jgi:hypothetical protein
VQWLPQRILLEAVGVNAVGLNGREVPKSQIMPVPITGQSVKKIYKGNVKRASYLVKMQGLSDS